METLNNTGEETNISSQINKKKLKIQKKKEAKKKQKLKKQLKINGNETFTGENGTRLFIKKDPSMNGNNNKSSSGIDDVLDEFKIDESDPTFELYSKLLNHFDGNDDKMDIDNNNENESKPIDSNINENNNSTSSSSSSSNDINKKPQGDQDMKDDEDSEQGDDNGNEENESNTTKGKQSNRERKRQRKASLPILKQLVDRPDVVELHDVNSPNPTLLISLKSQRNSIPVPAHWCQKRKYLQGKRGYVKPPFELPSFIAATGISKIRDALIQKEQKKSTKQKQRERLQPKMRSMDIDYEVLRDAFFIHQTKPKLTITGDLYYEGKEFQVHVKNKKPGVISDELKKALGMVEGSPPPWLVYMQYFGPPPSYPNLKIPGVNAPIPEGAEYGMNMGAWGRPITNVDSSSHGEMNGDHDQVENYKGHSRDHWGELIPDIEIQEEEEEEEEEQLHEPVNSDLAGEESSGSSGSGTAYADQTDGTSSIPSGLETPDIIDIKKTRMSQFDNTGAPKALFHVLEQQNVSTSGNSGNIMESSHRYQIPSIIKGNSSTSSTNRSGNHVDIIKGHRAGPDVVVTINPSELENMDEISGEFLKKKYEQTISQNNERSRPKDDYSDIIAEQSKKRKQQLQKEEKTKFKF